MRTLFIPLFIVSSLIYSCSGNINDFDNEKNSDNKFKDTELQRIYQLQNDRNTKELLAWFDHSNPACRETAVLAFASVQDTASLEKLLNVLEKDESIRIRAAAAFSIGQTSDSAVEDRLIKLVTKEKSPEVQNKIYEAIGKCGTYKGHDFLSGLIATQTNSKSLQGILFGLARFSIRGIASDSALTKIVKLLADEKTDNLICYFASLYLSRLKGVDVKNHFGALASAFNRSTDVFVKINIVSSLSKAHSDESIAFLKNLLVTQCDYRIKVNALRSLSNFPYHEVNATFIQSLGDSNINVAIQASEYFLAKGIKQDAALYFKKAGMYTNWRVRANLLNAAFVNSSQRTEILGFIINSYKQSSNIYEKAELLKVLGNDLNCFEFVSGELVASKELPIKTAAIETLAEMRRNSGFNSYQVKYKLSGKGDLKSKFALIFQDAIMSGDLARVGIAAEILRDPNLDFREQYQNNYFLNQALSNCKLPAGIEIYRELRKTIAFFNGTEYVEQKASQNTTIDWAQVIKIPVNQQIEIITSKGKIVAELYVNDAPVSVANFIKLISEGYFNNKQIHRVVPNFVIQDGCPRGDGWGGPDYTICSEFAMNYFTEGSLGMASAGKDTEGSQWYITHSPTPHLDGKYTNFGKVIKGMEVVHLLEVGDKIIGIDIIESK